MTSTPPTESTPSDTLPRDRQRNALRELVRLATESAAAEAEIEAEYARLLSEAKDKHERSLWALDQRAESQRQQIVEKHAERTAAAREQKAAAEQQARAQDKQVRAKIAAEYQQSATEIRKKLDHNIWLADSMLEGTQAKLKQDGKKAAEELENETNAIGEVTTQAAAILHTYGQPDLALQSVEAELEQSDEPTKSLYEKHLESAKEQTAKLGRMPIPRLFVGVWPFIIVVLLMGGAGAYTHFIHNGGGEPDAKSIGIAVGSAFVLSLIVGVALRVLAKRQVRDAWVPLSQTLERARLAAERKNAEAAAERKRLNEEAIERRNAEVKQIKDRTAPVSAKVQRKRDESTAAADQELNGKLASIEEIFTRGTADADAWRDGRDAELAGKLDELKQAERARYTQQLADAESQYKQRRADLEQRLADGLKATEAPTASKHHTGTASPRDWSDPAWQSWQPTREFAPSVVLGEVGVDLPSIANTVDRETPLKIELPPPFHVPVVLAFPRQASLLIETDRTHRARAIELLQMAMIRLLTSLPPGRVKFTILDPVGLGQNFAGFMHLADYDESLVGGRIWTDTDQIEQKLANLTDHMETVIQKYLRNEFETIDDYNAQAGELAEPYRFLVIADFPVGFTEESARRLASIATSGPRCGVYTLIACDTRQQIPQGLHLEDIEHNSLVIAQDGEKLKWKDKVFDRFPLSLDPAPGEDFLTTVLHKVGRGAREANRVEVPFESIAPTPDQFWSRSTKSDFAVPIGRMGATKLQSLRLGKGVAQHVLIAGKTGSGKSTLLNAIVTNAAMWFGPDEIEFYLVDFKKGVEFKAYATLGLPHARAIAVESDREFGLSVLQRLDAELTRRGELFRKAGVQDLASYRETRSSEVGGRTSGSAPDASTPNPEPSTPTSFPIPRTLLIIDEFQEFFSEDDKLAQDAALLLDRLVRQGRAFGIHVILGSQTIGGSSGLSRATLGQMAVRVALQTSEADSQIILGDANTAARLLTRPGEAIYNDAGGLVEANSPFQIAWLPDPQREKFLAAVRNKLNGRSLPYEPTSVFEGNAPADLTANRPLRAMLDRPPAGDPPATIAYVGDPVAIKDPTAVTFRRQSGSNLLVIGQQDEQALAALAASMVSIAAQWRSTRATVYLLDGTPADSPLFGQLQQIGEALPIDLKPVDYRAVPETIASLAQELESRGAADADHGPIFILIAGLQRFRQLRKGDDDFSFSLSSDDKGPNTGKQFADLLREGPNAGIHTLAWVDTQASIDRTLDRGSLREFDWRILFQMSANDSSALIDSPSANRLGFFRAIAYSEEQGVMEKFRPYALPPVEWIRSLVWAAR